MAPPPEPTKPAISPDEHERLRRWRLILGEGIDQELNEHDKRLDEALTALYGNRGKKMRTTGGKQGLQRSPFGRGTGGGQRSPFGSRSTGRRTHDQGREGGLGASMPSISGWLGDVRELFPDAVVQLMQQDAIERVGLQKLLSEPDILEKIEPDVHLVAAIMSLKDAVPEESKASARILVAKVVDDLLKRLRNPMQQAVRGVLNRAQRNRRPKFNEIDWNHTVRRNLKHYQPKYKSVIPEHLVGFGRKKRKAVYDIIICIDQSGSMSDSMVYASIFGAVMASIPALQTRLITFDTSVVDLTDKLEDPVEVLFGVQLGGGTDINQALTYAQNYIARPENTTLVLITDLYEGGNRYEMLQRADEIVRSGVSMITLLALSDNGSPNYNHEIASRFAKMGIVSFACTPDHFPELMAAALNRDDMHGWASQREIKVVSPEKSSDDF